MRCYPEVPPSLSLHRDDEGLTLEGDGPSHQSNTRSFVIATLVFGFAHHEWLAGILCACIYHGLIFRKNRLGDAMTAHAITNFLLGLWVVWKGAWHFW